MLELSVPSHYDFGLLAWFLLNSTLIQFYRASWSPVLVNRRYGVLSVDGLGSSLIALSSHTYPEQAASLIYRYARYTSVFANCNYTGECRKISTPGSCDVSIPHCSECDAIGKTCKCKAFLKNKSIAT